ncbi:MAG: ribosome-associated translation inhibitor RaiA [Bacteroidetes bacterium]|nr:ribosome-associated translation inhibitor RaiA [Bacteroidota bacterium]
MDITITARHFKAHDSLRMYAFDAVKKLERYYNGIISANVILSYEKAQRSVKKAEFHINVYGTLIKALEKSDDFMKSIDSAMEKAERQIRKYKGKQREKYKIVIRQAQAKV